MPGSHVILQGPPGTDPDRETLHRAAAIAAYHSKARDAGVVAVSGTRVRDVSKPRGAKAGTVQIRHETGVQGAPGAWRPGRGAWQRLCLTLLAPGVTGASVGAGSRVPAWAGAAAARQAGTRPRPPTAQRGS